MAKSATAASVPHTAIVSDLRKVFNKPNSIHPDTMSPH